MNVKNEEGMTPLHCAVNAENVDLVKVLVEHGADVKLKNNQGETAAELAGAIIESRQSPSYYMENSRSLINITLYLSDK